MRKIKFTLLAILSVLTVTAYSQVNNTKKMEKKQIMVAYFSATGTTKQVATKLAHLANADLCEIIPTERYTSADLNWNDRESRSSIEMNNPQARPKIRTTIKDVRKYDYIFLGYPIWWDLAPRVVNTFIESHQLNGKTIIPFATSGGSTITGSVIQLKKAYPKLHWQTGKLLNRANDQDLKAWLHTVLD